MMEIMGDQSSPSISYGQEEDDKNLKQSEDTSKDGSVEVEVKQTGFDDLPPEMLEEILKKLDVPSLLSCRLVNRRFDELSCAVLKSQTRIQVEQGFKNKLFTKGKNHNFPKFVKCFKKSQNFPCSRYRFKLNDNVNQEGFRTFISACQNTIKSLDLALSREMSAKNLTCYLKDLLLNHLPNLEEFGLRLDNFSGASPYNLFPRIRDQDESSELSKLKILRISPGLLNKFPGVVTDLIVAAVNLKKIEPFIDSTPFSKVDQFQFFHSLGKLDLLQEARISPSNELFSWVQTSMEQGNPVTFKLSKLILRTFYVFNEPSILQETHIFINNLLDSVKDTLTKFKVQDLRALGLDGIEFPKFKKLGELSGFLAKRTNFPCNMKFLNAEKFPALKELNLSLGYVSVQFPVEDPISVIPSIKTVNVSTVYVNADFIKQLAALCPNLIELNILGVLANFSSVGSSIWTHMTKLESLSLSIFGSSGSGRNSTASIVSTFTGISQENSQLLLNRIKNIGKNLMKLSKELQRKQRLKISESQLQKWRENSSILDLKELKKLSIILHGSELSRRDKESCIQISKINAFDYIPNLTVSCQIY